jgi:glutamate/tyrosine decarboxylase-like PLP-dependent enzyme
MEEVLLALAEKLQDNYPYFHPLYAGQMLKPPHPVARLAYSLAMYINPNNHALDGGRATSALEKEAVAEIAAMFGWKEFLGHLCGGGTMANLRRCGWRGRFLRARKFWRASRHTTRMEGSPVCCTCRLKKSRQMRADEWM